MKEETGVVTARNWSWQFHLFLVPKANPDRIDSDKIGLSAHLRLYRCPTMPSESGLQNMHIRLTDLNSPYIALVRSMPFVSHFLLGVIVTWRH